MFDMNDSYVECMVAKKSSPLLGVLRYIIYILTGVSVIAVLTGIVYFIIPLIIFALLCFLVVPGFEIEYEYLYLDREISIDKILSKQKRKKIRTLELSKMEFFCPIGSHRLDPYKSGNIKKSEYTSGEEDAGVWVLVYKGETGKELIALEPNEAMLKIIKSLYPGKVAEH